MEHFSERLRYIRKQRRLSQKALADACGLSQSAIANYESKTRKQAKNVFLLADVLQVNAEWLANGSGPMLGTEPAANTVKQPGGAPREAAWPFARIPPHDYWLLHPEDRQVVEDTVHSLILSLRERALQR